MIPISPTNIGIYGVISISPTYFEKGLWVHHETRRAWDKRRWFVHSFFFQSPDDSNQWQTKASESDWDCMANKCAGRKESGRWTHDKIKRFTAPDGSKPHIICSMNSPTVLDPKLNGRMDSSLNWFTLTKMAPFYPLEGCSHKAVTPAVRFESAGVWFGRPIQNETRHQWKESELNQQCENVGYDT
jgi:hypothetical protein